MANILKSNGVFPTSRDINYRQCSMSVMDTISDPDIRFDETGICNYYNEYLVQEKREVLKGDAGLTKFNEQIEEIKKAGKNKPYDCITGVSGGVDSTYLCLMAKRAGLRPLVVHFDNGWNSEIAVANINNLINILGFDLYTLVVGWEEFKDLQLAYLKSSVIDIEVLTDHAIIGTIYKLASKYNISYILSGSNVVTEATLPKSWIYNKTDHVNIRDIHNKFGTMPIKTFPLFDSRLKKIAWLKGIRTLSLLNYLPYNKSEVKKTIMSELGWKDYGGKHYESVFTRFYQGYILPEKYRIDKRKAHLSNLIFSKQISKKEALKELESPPYQDALLAQDYEFVLKKLSLSPHEFEAIMLTPRKEHMDFDFEKPLHLRYPVLKPAQYIVNMLKKNAKK